MNFSGYVGHATIFCWMSTIASCLVVWLGLRVRFRFSFCLASDYEHTILSSSPKWRILCRVGR